MTALAVGLTSASHSLAVAPVMTMEQRHLSMTPKAYALEMVIKSWNNDREFKCLAKLWGKESAWNPKAFNPIKVNGKNAGGIPQILGLNPKLHHTIQINYGLKYITHRYKTPCNAWAFWLAKAQKGTGWY